MAIEHRDVILAAFGIPADAIDIPSDGLVHWRGLDEQEMFTPLGPFRPTRCGDYRKIATLSMRVSRLTCPKCRELVSVDEQVGGMTWE